MLAERAEIRRGGDPRDELHGQRAAQWGEAGQEAVRAELPACCLTSVRSEVRSSLRI